MREKVKILTDLMSESDSDLDSFVSELLDNVSNVLSKLSVASEVSTRKATG